MLTRLIIAAAIASAGMAQAEVGLPGYDRLDVRAEHRAWPIAASVWYPAARATYAVPIGDNPIFRGVPAFVGAAMPDEQYPVILFSHGSGGNMDASAWLSSDLAQRGAIVLSVNHQGSTSGDSSPRRSVRLADRAQDLSAALDALLADPYFAGRLDLSRVTAVGFSLGGATALNLAGVQFQGQGYAPYCAQDPLPMDCAFFAKGGVDFEHLPVEFSADMADARVTGAIAIDPAFTYVATDESLRNLSVPIGLINLGDADRLVAADVSSDGSGFAARIGDVSYSEFVPANHFTFLAECKEMAEMILREEGEDPICTDPPETDRAAVHQQIADAIAEFAGL